MSKVVSALYSVICYALFLGIFLYAVGFVEGFGVPKTLDSGPARALIPSIIVNLILLSVFAIQHSVMARPAFKRAWTKIMPETAERSTFVLLASLALALVMWQWRPIPQTIWRVDNPTLASALIVVSLVGWAIVLISTFLISHFHLFGLTQGFAKLLGRQQAQAQFGTPFLYKWSRHPLYAGFIVAFWAAPVMSVGHLLFAAVTTGYILVGIWFEERDLIDAFGARYEQYRTDVGMLLPRFKARSASKAPRL